VWLLLSIAALIVVVPLTVVLQPTLIGSAADRGVEAAAVLSLRRPNVYVPLAFAFASAAVLAWWIVHTRSRLPAAIATTLVAVDMAFFATHFHRTIDTTLYEREPEMARILRQDATPHRKLSVWTSNAADLRTAQESLGGNWALVWGVEDANGYTPFEPRRHLDYLFSPRQEDVSYGFFVDQRLLQPESPILSSLNVKYVLVPTALRPRLGPHLRPVFANEHVRAYENQNVLPRAYFASTVRTERDARRVLQAVTAAGFDRGREAIVESDIAPIRSVPSPDRPASVEFTERTPNRLVLETSTEEERFLVFSEAYFPGWHARIDGAPTAIYRTNYLFRGIVVPAGKHTLELAYRPPAAVLGAVISGLALLVAGTLFLARPRAVPVATSP
jgi:hypothetical protein